MNHEFSELQELLGQTARELFSRDFPLDRMRDGYRTDEGYDTELWPSIVDLGWNSAPFPEEMGGTGGGLFDTVLLLEEMGKGYCVSPYPHSTIAAGLALVEADADLAQAIAADEAVVIPALTAADGVTQMASRDGDGAITLTDRRLVVPWVELATHLLVPLPNGDEMAVIEAGADGVGAELMPSSGGEPLYDVSFEGASGRVVSAAGLQDHVTLLGAIANSVLMLGLCQRSLELASEYSKTRVAFGKPIGTFQAISHKCANMVVDIETGRNLCYKAAWLHSTGQEYEMGARYAKAFMGDATARITRDAIQVHGGVGFIDDHFVQFPYRIGTAAACTYGTAHEHRRAVASAILD
ncbi:MAG: acyl-CoA dehydrogenase [Chloroflexi bacterium]|nr:acyl-CoA dehydrogenase [Chloroflexota bacterium]